MNNITDPYLDKQKIDEIYQYALKTLAEIGVGCPSHKAIDILKEKTKITHKNDRIYFNQQELDEYFQKRKLNIRSDKDDMEFEIVSHWSMFEICDPITNMPRAATEKEAIDMARLTEQLGAKNCPIPVSCGDVPPVLRTLEAEKIGLIYTKHHSGRLTATNFSEIRYLIDMNQACGRKYKLALEGLISPLKFNERVFDVYFEFYQQEDVDIEIFTAIPMAGATAPLVFPANLVQVLAEGIALDFVFNILSDGKHNYFGLRLDPFDFKSANIVFGSPQWCLFHKALKELWKGLIGDENIYGSFRTNARNVDGQALIERTGSFLFQAVMGVRKFSAVGQISIDEVFSPVQAMLDLEILKYVKGLCQSYPFIDSDILSIIKEGIEQKEFISSKTTVENFRSMFDMSMMSTADNLNTWRAKGSRDLQAVAWEAAQKLINDYSYELDSDKRKDVELIYAKCKKYIQQQ